MRLDLFLPFLKRPHRGESAPEPSRLTRFARAVLPASWFADTEKGKPGRLRRLLKWLGPAWLSSPTRRVIQTVCFVLFLVLFFYVCWPYTAAPDPVAPHAVRLQDGSVVAGTIVEESPDAVRVRLPPAGAGASGEVPAASPAAEFREIPREQIAGIKYASHYADDLAAKERANAEIFLVLDPLVSLTTAVAGRAWVWSLVWAGVILALAVFVPRGFCGYLCPLGTLIDLFDWVVGKRVTRFRVEGDGWWVNLKYYLLLGTLIAAFFGVLLSGLVAAIPVLTRGFLFLFEPVQTGLLRGWYLVPPIGAGQIVSILLFFVVLGLGLFRPRFWCRYVCPTGAVFSVGNLFRVSERKVETSCIHCNKCVEICPFDAIKPDFTTRTLDCTLCQTCGGVCPTHAIKFVGRWESVDLKDENDRPVHETPVTRRGFLAGAAAGALSAVGISHGYGADLSEANQDALPVRPPGSLPEQEFLQQCIRCGECFKACPNNVLQPEGFQQGLEGLWTPLVAADWAGCEPSCNACGQVCPTGAIRELAIEEKRAARMGLAIVDPVTCLPWAEKEACQLCVDECTAAGYNAIEFERVGVETDADGFPVPDSGYAAPVVLNHLCVGCGLCQSACYRINAKEKGLLAETAILVLAGMDKDGAAREDRMREGSYVALREKEQAERQRAMERQQEERKKQGLGDFY